MTPTSRVVEADGGRHLATCDYSGDGPPLVLMHGAGMDQRSLAPVAELLRPAHRVVTFDFRGHGGSDAAPWSVATAVQDLRDVARAYDLTDPAVGGHSLGGMVAVAYGLQQLTCPGVVNIDGHGRGRTDQYPGYDEDQVLAGWATQDRRIDALTTGPVAAGLRGLLRLLRKPTVATDTVRQVRREVDALDLFAMYRELRCPLLVFNAVATEERRLMRAWAGEGVALAAAYRAGLVRDLDTLAAERPRTEVATVDATHMLIRTHPELVAQRITEFLQS